MQPSSRGRARSSPVSNVLRCAQAADHDGGIYATWGDLQRPVESSDGRAHCFVASPLPNTVQMRSPPSLPRPRDVPALAPAPSTGQCRRESGHRQHALSIQTPAAGPTCARSRSWLSGLHSVSVGSPPATALSSWLAALGCTTVSSRIVWASLRRKVAAHWAACRDATLLSMQTQTVGRRSNRPGPKRTPMGAAVHEPGAVTVQCRHWLPTAPPCWTTADLAFRVGHYPDVSEPYRDTDGEYRREHEMRAGYSRGCEGQA